MVLKTTLKKSKILYLLFTLSFFLIPYTGEAQTRIYASTATTSNTALSPNEVVGPGLAHDGNLTTSAVVKANAGGLLGLGAFNGYIDLQFPGNVPANTTTYVKITTEDNLLPALLGGSLGNLLANVLGAVLIGNQEFSVEANLNGGAAIISGNSQVNGSFAGDRLRIVRNDVGDFLIAITPATTYNHIKVTNRIGATLLGLGNEKNMNVFEAYYVSAPANCGSPAYTSFSGTGITLDLLQLGSAGVTNPQNAIDANTTNFSTLSLGVLGVGSTVEQTVYFEGLSNATDQFGVRIRLAQTLLNLDVINDIRVISSNGGTEVSNQSLATLLTLSLLGPPQGNVITTIPVNPGAPVDRITLRFYSFVSLSVAQNLDFFGVTRTVAPPTIVLPPLSTGYIGCVGTTASLTATTGAGNELRWYTAPTGGVATIRASGVAFVTPVLTTTTTFYVAAAKIGCPEESARVAVKVTVTPVGTPTTIDTTPEFCAFNNPTVVNIQVNEPNISFYDNPTGGIPIPPATPLVDNKIYYASITDAVTGCGSTIRLAITVDLLPLCDVTLNLKVMLQGALFNATGGLMRDDLRTGGYIPLNQPYSNTLNARFTHVGGGGTETTTSAVLQANAGTGNAIVDWVFVEIRDNATPLTVLKTVSALLQRDGDIVAANGGPLLVTGLPATFKVSVKHRNHLGAMASQTLTAVNQQVTLDFTTLTNANLFALTGFTGQEAMATVGSVRALYCSNANFDTQVKYDGLANDRQVVASQVLSFPANASQILNYSNATGYFSGDVNMDGKVLYDGTNNDRQIILNIIVTYPLNTNTLANYNGMFEQMPQ
jgi:hypothetical protein